MKKIARGSVLAYSLILLSILLIVSIGMMSSSIVDLKSLSSNDNSVNAFQIADSGSQAIVASIKKDNSGNIGDLATRMGLSCSNGLVESSLLNGAYRVSFYGDASTAPLSCTDTLSSVTSVKSVGSYRDSARAVSVAVAAGCSQPGQEVVVARGSDKNFSSSDSAKVMNFLGGRGNRLSGSKCINSSGAVMVYQGSLGASTGTTVGIETANYISCTSDCFAIGGGTYSGSCSGGWEIYGICGMNDY